MTINVLTLMVMRCVDFAGYCYVFLARLTVEQLKKEAKLSAHHTSRLVYNIIIETFSSVSK